MMVKSGSASGSVGDLAGSGSGSLSTFSVGNLIKGRNPRGFWELWLAEEAVEVVGKLEEVQEDLVVEERKVETMLVALFPMPPVSSHPTYVRSCTLSGRRWR